MPNTASAIKDVRKNARRRLRNRVSIVATRTHVKIAQQALAANSDQVEQKVREAMQALDKAAQKGIVHKNNAARRKARLAKKLKAAQSATK